jgi:hypothetical protein
MKSTSKKGTSRRMGEGAVGTHRNTDCLLTNTSTKHIKYVFNQNSKILMRSFSKIFLGAPERFYVTK